MTSVPNASLAGGRTFTTSNGANLMLFTSQDPTGKYWYTFETNTSTNTVFDSNNHNRIPMDFNQMQYFLISVGASNTN